MGVRIKLIFKMAVAKVNKSLPQDAAAKKDRAVARAQARHKARSLKPGAKKDQKTEAKKPKKAADKFRPCRMRKIYRTQLPMSYAPAKGCAKHPNRPTKLRKGIVPGTVCIVLAGRHQSKKVVVLKQLRRSGLLLVTGPHKVNGIPLRRVDQKHVIATSEVVPFPAGFKVPAHVDDLFFKHSRATKRQSTTKAKPAVLNK